MGQRKRIAAGNWKMNTSLEEGVTLASTLAREWKGDDERTMMIAPPYTHLTRVHGAIQHGNILLAAQNCHWESKGAFTGEVSLSMLKEAGVTDVIVGHSERREYFHESNEIIRKKVDAVLAAGLRVILCCGEPLSVREAGAERDFVGDQLSQNLLHLQPDQMVHVVIAYEPIWAIGTGVTATAEQAQEMHAFIRSLLAGTFASSVAEATPILYGGSVNASNAPELFSQPDVDGGLVGGASLKAQEFLAIAGAL